MTPGTKGGPRLAALQEGETPRSDPAIRDGKPPTRRRQVRILGPTFAAALVEPGQLEERVEELLSCRGPLVLEGASPLERLRQQVAEAGFTLVDASRGAPACWAFADPQLRQVVLLIADREHDGRVLLGISGRDYERVPAWCHRAIARLVAPAAT